MKDSPRKDSDLGAPAVRPYQENRFPREAAVVAVPLGAGEKAGIAPEENSERGSAEGGRGAKQSARNPHSTPATTSKSEIRNPKSEAEWREAEAKAAVCREFERLRTDGMSLSMAATSLGKSGSWFSGEDSPYARWQREGVAGLLPRRSETGAKASFVVPDWFVPAARFFWLLSNRTWCSGSVPEAVRRTISLPHVPPGWTEGMKGRLVKAVGRPSGAPLPDCPVELREMILAREKEGKDLVPDRIARQITARRATVIQQRNPTNASLDYLCSPGSLFFITDSRTGQRRPPLCGEVIEADDATINFPVCVPWTLGGDPCSDKWGVKVGRFQWLVSVDAARRFITAYTYVMRPRSSYRAEDALALVLGHCQQHGKPRVARFEQGVWKSKLVKSALAGAGIELQTVWSPHQKPFIEGLFNTVWTKLSVHFPESQVGRFRGENEEANDFLRSCQRGAHNPQNYFPMLADAITAFGESVAEKNGTPVKSAIGSWVPGEAWSARAPGERLDAETEWLFAPWLRTWKVRGMLVGGRVPIFEDLSVPFDFSAPWLAQWDGATVDVHFDPTAPRCHGMLVLAENFKGEKAGKVLGLAQQINEVAGYARLVMGWGDDPTNAGRLARQQAASALRREVRGIVPSGRGLSKSEERDGVSQVGRVEAEGTNHGGTEPQRGKERTTAPAQDDAELTARERAVEVDELEFL